jgi:hypothetical protein
MIAVTIGYPNLSVVDRFSGILMTWDRDLESEIMDELCRCGDRVPYAAWEPWPGRGWCLIMNTTEAKRKEIARAIKIAFNGDVKVS